MNDNRVMKSGIPLVSVHGGHSGEFCCHARDRLEDIIHAYAQKGFEWVGITEHMPPPDNRFLYPDERKAGLDAQKMFGRFERYITECRRLQKKYAGVLEVFTAFETEAYDGALDSAEELMARFEPDYMVGSVHHVNGIPIDGSPGEYHAAAETAGGVDALYMAYFDLQDEMIQRLNPSVVGHFDLIRMFDPDYPVRLEKPEIKARIHRNLEHIREKGLILDFNLRALFKGAAEPYVSAPILAKAMEMGIPLVPGDDSHGVDSVGLNLEKGIKILQQAGFKGPWPRPVHTTPIKANSSLV